MKNLDGLKKSLRKALQYYIAEINRAAPSAHNSLFSNSTVWLQRAAGLTSGCTGAKKARDFIDTVIDHPDKCLSLGELIYKANNAHWGKNSYRLFSEKLAEAFEITIGPRTDIKIFFKYLHGIINDELGSLSPNELASISYQKLNEIGKRIVNEYEMEDWLSGTSGRRHPS
ncbi:MAG: hypothetical protein Q7V63_06875 [Gammaproteobacteria bacterium]|nr:hypothetical protein [Gammaproteobacteria bacterium]